MPDQLVPTVAAPAEDADGFNLGKEFFSLATAGVAGFFGAEAAKANAKRTPAPAPKNNKSNMTRTLLIAGGAIVAVGAAFVLLKK